MQTAWFKGLTALVAGLGVAGFLSVPPARAQNTPPDRKPTPPPIDKAQVDQHLNDFLRDAINQGAGLYNNGDATACYNLFRSSLVAAWYVLDHRPELRREINAALTRADGQATASDRAVTLRAALDATRQGLNVTANKGTPASPATTRPAEPAQPTLWQRLGGEAKVRQVIDDFVKLAGKDPNVDFTRGGRYNLSAEQMANFKQQMVNLISQETGGPFRYDGRPLARAHKGMGITNAQFDASVTDLRKALADNNVKADDVDALVRIVETTRSRIVEPKGGEGTAKPATNPRPAEGTRPETPNPTTGRNSQDQKPTGVNPEIKRPFGTPATEFKGQDNKAPRGDGTRPPQARTGADRKPTDKTAGKEDEKKAADAIDVKGKVSYRGKPLADATVAFVPRGENTTGRRRLALTTTNGSYAIKDIQPGEYTVVIIPPKSVAFPEKYKDVETSDLKAKVTRDEKNFDFSPP